MTTLLIVDDRPINREVLSSLLDDKHKYTVLEAEDGLQALELIRNNTIDLLITDIAMPKMDGLTLVKELQTDPIYAKIPVIFYTATYKASEAYSLTNFPNIKYALTKPCDPEIILGTIEGVLDPNSQFFNRKNKIPELSESPYLFSKSAKKEKLESINLRLTNIIEIGLDMSLEHNLEKLISILCRGGRQFLNADFGGVLIKDSNNHGQYRHFTATNNPDLNFNQIDVDNFSESLKDLFLNDEILCIHSPIIDIEKLGLLDASLPLSSILILPLKTAQVFYGKVYFINKKNCRFFTPGDQRFMMTLADKFSVNYENLILYQKVDQHAKQLEKMAEIVRSNSLGEMASSLAHEINQPLAAIAAYIKGCINRLETKKEVTPEILQVLNETNFQVERLGEVVHRIKRFVRKGELFYETMNINTIVLQGIQLIKQELSTHVEIAYTQNPKLPQVEVDKIQIQQVLLNLLRNAIEAMKSANSSKPKITIDISLKDKTRVMVSIRDNGPGFSEDIANQLFELYFTTKPQGMGLGLAISRSVIEAHSGQLTAFNLPEGGSCFQFDLPIKNHSKKQSQILMDELLR